MTVVVAALLVAIAILLDAQARVDLEDEREAREAAALAVVPMAQIIGEQSDKAAIGLGPGTRQVGIDAADGPSEEPAALARDTAQPALDPLGGGVIVMARYDPPGPTTVAARRASLIGYSVTPLVLVPAMDSLETDRASLVVLGPTSQVAASGGVDPDEAAGDVVRFRLAMNKNVAPGWGLEALVSRGGISSGAWLAALFVLAVGLVGAFVLARKTQRDEHHEADLVRRQRSDATLTELGSVAQASLDLAEVLPASFAVLESALDLDGVSLLSTGARPTFVWRNAPAADDPLHPLEAPAPAGCCLEVPLTRGGRSLGALRVRARRDLDELDLRALIGAAEVLSAAVANSTAYAQQQALITRMRALDDLKTVFVATASHELRTPVAAVTGYASMLVEDWDSLDRESGLLYAKRVDSNARRLSDLVEHLLDFSRLEQGGTYSGADDLLDLGAEVQDLIEAQPHLTPDHELLLRVDKGLMVSGSKLAIERVLTNLVGNAVKYSPAGTTIRVRVMGDDAGAHLAVDDEGPGVSEEEREQIFSRFFRGKGDEVVRTRGAGLGLSIVTEFAASMGGEVSIGASPSGGARFEVTYPLLKPGTIEHVLLGDPDDPS